MTKVGNADGDGPIDVSLYTKMPYSIAVYVSSLLRSFLTKMFMIMMDMILQDPAQCVAIIAAAPVN